MKTLTHAKGKKLVRATIRTERCFSLTGSVYERSRRYNDPDYTEIDRKGYIMVAGGAMGDELVKIWPKLRPINDLHLSDVETGEPMYGFDNGWHWLAGYLTAKGCPDELTGPTVESYKGCMVHTPEKCREIFARMMRISVADAEALATQLTPMPRGQRKSGFLVWYRDQLDRFKAEAKAARSLIETL